MKAADKTFSYSYDPYQTRLFLKWQIKDGIDKIVIKGENVIKVEGWEIC